jgi:hypothetical protein
MAKPCARGACICEPPGRGDSRGRSKLLRDPWHAAGIGLVVFLVLLVALWVALAHAGEAEDKLLARQMIAENWPELVSACGLGLTLQPQPEWDAPPDGALRARCVNGAKFYIKLTSPAEPVWKGGPTVFRCDGAYMRDAIKCRGW